MPSTATRTPFKSFVLLTIKICGLLIASLVLMIFAVVFTDAGFLVIGLAIAAAMISLTLPYVRKICFGPLPQWFGYTELAIGLLTLVCINRQLHSPGYEASILSDERKAAITTHDASAYLDHLAVLHGHDALWMSELSVVDPDGYRKELKLQQEAAVDAAQGAIRVAEAEARKSVAAEEARKTARLEAANAAARLAEKQARDAVTTEEARKKAEIELKQHQEGEERQKQIEIASLKAVPRRQLDKDPEKAAEVYGRLAELDPANTQWEQMAARARQTADRHSNHQTSQHSNTPTIKDVESYRSACTAPRSVSSFDKGSSFLMWRKWTAETKVAYTCASVAVMQPQLGLVDRVGFAFGLEACMNALDQNPEGTANAQWNGILGAQSIDELSAACAVMITQRRN